jgi:hypothetical protein
MNTEICNPLSLINLFECTGGEHCKPKALSGFNACNFRVIWHTLIVLLYDVGVYFQFTFHAHTARNEQL